MKVYGRKYTMATRLTQKANRQKANRPKAPTYRSLRKTIIEKDYMPEEIRNKKCWKL